VSLNNCSGVKFSQKDSQGITYCFEQVVLDHFLLHRQIPPTAKEAGGQLFGKFNNDIVYVCCATGPRNIDRSGRFFFNPSRWLEQLEIKRKFRQGLHYIGDWHTHPQKKPTPSSLDIQSMNDCYEQSIHQLPYFALVIVGQTAPPKGLWVSLHNGKQWLELFCLKEV
jgi:integrative and conjugative element protein (TIGR02256 family)